MGDMQVAIVAYIVLALCAAVVAWREHAHLWDPGHGRRSVLLSAWMGLWWPVVVLSVVAWWLRRGCTGSPR